KDQIKVQLSSIYPGLHIFRASINEMSCVPGDQKVLQTGDSDWCSAFLSPGERFTVGQPIKIDDVTVRVNGKRSDFSKGDSRVLVRFRGDSVSHILNVFIIRGSCSRKQIDEDCNRNRNVCD